MTTKQIRSMALLAMLPFIHGFQTARAQLPILDQPWIGYFAVAESRAFQFLIGQNGSVEIVPLNKDGGKIQLPVTLQFLALETLPDGSVRELVMKPETLESADEPPAKSKEVIGAGSSEAWVEIGAYQKRKFEFLAAPNSSLTIGNASLAPLHNGFWFEWSADAAKDSRGTAKLAIRIK